MQCSIFVKTVIWEGPHQPLSKWDKIKEIRISDIEGFHSIEKEINLVKTDKKYFLTCSMCKKTIICGHMHDEKICQGCAEKTGVIY